MKCPYCGKGNVFFGDTCPNPRCRRVVHDNTSSMDQFWARGKSGRDKPEKSGSSFFSPAWAIPFKLLWLPVRMIWWLVKIRS